MESVTEPPGGDSEGAFSFRMWSSFSPWQFALIGGASIFLMTQGQKCSLKLHLIKSLEEKENQEKGRDVRVERLEFAICLVRIRNCC